MVSVSSAITSQDLTDLVSSVPEVGSIWPLCTRKIDGDIAINYLIFKLLFFHRFTFCGADFSGVGFGDEINCLEHMWFEVAAK